MKLNRLKLHLFKNHQAFDVALYAPVVGVYGLNGKGKTNILDAVFMLCVGKSYFSSLDNQCIFHEEKEASVIGYIEKDAEYEVKLKLKRGGKKSIEVNGKKRARLVDHLGHFYAVVIAPGDIGLIYGDNADRRRFIDQTLSQTDKTYLEALVSYRKLLEQRNALLRSERVDEVLLRSYDERIAPICDQLYTIRQEFFDGFTPVVQRYYKQLSGGEEILTIDYDSQLHRQSYWDGSQQNRSKDLVLKRSNTGVHKDTITLMLDGDMVKKFGSQGQIKSFLIALKLAQYEHYMECSGLTPFLLLDDIFEKIDDERAKALTKIVKNGKFGQIFVTDTQKERLSAFCRSISEDHQLIGL